MSADDRVEIGVGPEAQLDGAPGVEVLRPSGHHGRNRGVDLLANTRDGLGAGNAFERRDFLANSGGKAGHGEIAALTQRSRVEAGGMQKERNGGAGAG